MTTAIAEWDRGRGVVVDEWNWVLDSARQPKLRTLTEFAEQEIVIPDGPMAGRRFRVATQPFFGLALGLIEQARALGARRVFLVGPPQSGKTLIILIVGMYYLFERREKIICGIPDMDMAGDKWREDLKPVIDRTRYAGDLPVVGAGSRGGGRLESVTFQNATTLKFMTGGAGDAERSGYTARVVIITEVDKMDCATGHGREGDKISQLESRVAAYGDDGLVFGECTVTVPDGRIWQEYAKGTATRIVVPCPKCGEYVAPERRHLTGWQEAETDVEAYERSRFNCPSCGKPWTDDQRRDMNAAARVVHRKPEATADQVLAAIDGELDDREVWPALGKRDSKPPPTRTLSFRWSAFNNLFWSTGGIAESEWRAARQPDEQNAEKVQRQQVWGVPYKSQVVDLSGLTPEIFDRQRAPIGRGFLPSWCDFVTLAIDLHLRHATWAVVGWSRAFDGHVTDYGDFSLPGDTLGPEKGFAAGLAEFRETWLAGWSLDGKARRPDLVVVDSGWETDAVYRVCAELNRGPVRVMPIMGFGANQWDARHKRYNQPARTSRTVVGLGCEYHVRSVPEFRINRLDINADWWKSFVHSRFATPAERDGSLTLFKGTPGEHRRFRAHVLAEKPEHVFVPGKGDTVVWRTTRSGNHYLDVTSYNAVAAHACGARLIRAPADAGGSGTWRRYHLGDVRIQQGMAGRDGLPFVPQR